MNLFYDPACLLHDTGTHPESAPRILAVLAALREHGVGDEMLQRPAPLDAALLAEVHDPRYVAAVERAALSGGGYWDLDTYISPGSYEAAVAACACAAAAAQSALDGTPAFAIGRPPGHHALYNSAMGFCLFNNAAVAAQHAVREGLERVLIIDWDVHHGNGTQDYFYARSDVLFFSTHQYPFYPGTGALSDTGSGDGRGYTVNVPLPSGAGDVGYTRAFTEILLPAARRFRPQLVLVSAGYDAHADDPLATMNLSLAGFYALAEMVRDMAASLPECRGRVAAVLEGGYNTEVLASSLLATLAAFDAPPGTQAAPAELPTPQQVTRHTREPDITHLLAQIKRVHSLDAP